MASFAERAHQAEKMDRMYRYARHIYDLTRKYYLLGRDTMLTRIAQSKSHHILEIGCGTARNLIRLAHSMPQANLYGLDASDMMLQTARRTVQRKGHDSRITLRQGFAETLHHAHTFGLSHKFDAIFFSYVLSMIPAWQQAIDTAMDNLAPGGRLFIVDFWDQAGLPPGFNPVLHRWLGIFNVYPRPEVLNHLRILAERKTIDLSISSHARRYAFIAQAVKMSYSASDEYSDF